MTRTTIVAMIGLLCALGCSASGDPFRDARRGDGGTNTEGGTINRDVQRIERDAAEDAPLDPDAACASQTSETQRAPMNLLILLDRSGSMGERPGGGSSSPTKWESARSAVLRLIDGLDAEARVGLTFFPARSNADSESGYTTPAVAIAPLGPPGSAQRENLRNTLMATSPTGATPMACAEMGSVQHYQSMFAMDGTRNIVLITDGVPTDECSGSTEDCLSYFPDTAAVSACFDRQSEMSKLRVLATASRGASSTPPIRTYAIGTTDADERFLSQVAVNGGTPRAAGCESSNSCHYSLGSSTFEMDLNRALDDIRGRAATCEFRIMIDPTMADPGLVNVRFTPSGGTERIVPRDTSHTDGWDYSPDMRSIILYGPVCDQVRADSGGRVVILYGCPTIG